jgi:hypothetical protein
MRLLLVIFVTSTDGKKIFKLKIFLNKRIFKTIGDTFSVYETRIEKFLDYIGFMPNKHQWLLLKIVKKVSFP